MSMLQQWLSTVIIPKQFDDEYKKRFYNSLELLKDNGKMVLSNHANEGIDNYSELSEEEYLEFFDILWDYNKLVNVSVFLQPIGISYIVEDGQFKTRAVECDNAVFTTKLNGIGLPKDLVEKSAPFLSTLYLCIFYIVKESKKITYDGKEYNVYKICYGSNTE